MLHRELVVALLVASALVVTGGALAGSAPECPAAISLDPVSCAPGGAPCDDGDACTVNDACDASAGVCRFDFSSWLANTEELRPYHECRWAQAATYLAAISAGTVEVDRRLVRRLARRVDALRAVAATTRPGTAERQRRFRHASKRMRRAWEKLADSPATPPGMITCLPDLLPRWAIRCRPSLGGCD